jgi:hypothetical protein
MERGGRGCGKRFGCRLRDTGRWTAYPALKGRAKTRSSHPDWTVAFRNARNPVVNGKTCRACTRSEEQSHSGCAQQAALAKAAVGIRSPGPSAHVCPVDFGESMAALGHEMSCTQKLSDFVAVGARSGLRWGKRLQASAVQGLRHMSARWTLVSPWPHWDTRCRALKSLATSSRRVRAAGCAGESGCRHPQYRAFGTCLSGGLW